MKREFKIILPLCSFLLLTTLSFADDCPMGKCEKMVMREKSWSKMSIDDAAFHKAHFILANASELGLNDSQIEKITVIKYNAKKTLIKADAEIESMALDIKQALGKPEIDVNQVNSLIDKKYSLKAKKAKDLIQAYVDIKKTLTSEQVKKLKDMYSMCMMNKCGAIKKEDKEHMMKMGEEHE